MTTSDVQLAAASEGRIIGFNVDPSEAVQAAAKQSGNNMFLLSSTYFHIFMTHDNSFSRIVTF